MILYKTTEQHSNGWDVYRKVGSRCARSRIGKRPGLSGVYFIFDGVTMYAVGKAYKDEYGVFDGEPEYPVFDYIIDDRG